MKSVTRQRRKQLINLNILLIVGRPHCQKIEKLDFDNKAISSWDKFTSP